MVENRDLEMSGRSAEYQERQNSREKGVSGENEVEISGDRKSTRLNSSHSGESRMPSSA